MFNKPIKHVRLKSVEEVKKFSHLNDRGKGEPKTAFMQNGEIFFCDENKQVWVTPYRSEIYSILKQAGYEEEPVWYECLTSKEQMEAYAWLSKIAEEENWAETYEEAYLYAIDNKGIMPVELQEKVYVKEIKSKYEYHQWILIPMIKQFLDGDSNQNIGTYILLDDKSVLVCDEYGRTFLISVKTTINDVVNALIDAGYSRTTKPQFYVKENKKDKNNNE